MLKKKLYSYIRSYSLRLQISSDNYSLEILSDNYLLEILSDNYLLESLRLMMTKLVNKTCSNLKTVFGSHS